jgi:hypothetical protein
MVQQIRRAALSVKLNLSEDVQDVPRRKERDILNCPRIADEIDAALETAIDLN